MKPVEINFSSVKSTIVLAVLAFLTTTAYAETAGDLTAATEDFQITVRLAMAPEQQGTDPPERP